MYVWLPPVGNVTVVVTVPSAGIEISVGRAPWCVSVPVRCTSWTVGVADDPLVLDRVLVHEHELDRPACRRAEYRREIAAVVDPDLHRDGPGGQLRGGCDGNEQGERRERADDDEESPAGARARPGTGRPRGRGPDPQQEPDESDAQGDEAEAESQPIASPIGASPRSPDTSGRTKPASTTEGRPRPEASTARS